MKLKLFFADLPTAKAGSKFSWTQRKKLWTKQKDLPYLNKFLYSSELQSID